MKPLNAEAWAGVKIGLLLGASVLALVLPPARPGAQAGVVTAASLPSMASTSRQGAAVAPHEPRMADLSGEQASDDVQRVAHWVADSRDNQRMSFVILDKRNTKVFLFDADGRLEAASPVLLGSAPGDGTAPGVGQKALHDVHPDEKTTPAGRFVAQPGRNMVPEDVVWVDYAAAVSMHRVRLTDPSEHRLERLASPTTADNRISYGCINMPVAFFEQHIWPAFKNRRGVVYILPEELPLQQVFAGLYDPADRNQDQAARPVARQ